MLGVGYLPVNSHQKHPFSQKPPPFFSKEPSLKTCLLLVKTMNIASMVDAIFIDCRCYIHRPLEITARFCQAMPQYGTALSYICAIKKIRTMKEAVIQNIGQQRLREILGKPENGSLSFVEFIYCVALSIKVFISFVVSKIMYIFANK